MTTRERRVFLGIVKSKKVGLEILLRTTQRGSGIYAYLPQDVCNVFGIRAGDRLQVKIVARHRLVSDLEQEKMDSTKEEKIEDVLVVPKVKRRRRKHERDKEKTDEEFLMEIGDPSREEEE